MKVSVTEARWPRRVTIAVEQFAVDFLLHGPEDLQAFKRTVSDLKASDLVTLQLLVEKLRDA